MALTLFIGGPWDGEVKDIKGAPFHYYVGVYRDRGEIRTESWSDKLYFDHDKLLKECYVHNVAFEGQGVYVHQPLTVRHACSAMMAAYHWAVQNGWQAPTDDPIAGHLSAPHKRIT